MPLDLTRVIIDFGLVVLIWMVQLIVYPSFLYYNDTALVRWHKRYMLNVSIVVIPLMFAQLGIYIFQALEQQTTFTILGISAVVILWMLTFVLFVPIHQQITNNHHSEYMLKQLVLRNWIRTLLWTGLFLWSLVEFL